MRRVGILAPSAVSDVLFTTIPYSGQLTVNNIIGRGPDQPPANSVATTEARFPMPEAAAFHHTCLAGTSHRPGPLTTTMAA